MDIPFYDEYFEFPAFSDKNESNKYKDKYIRENLLIDGFLYKFVSFSDDQDLNQRKLHLLFNSEIWLSTFKQFEDTSEIDIHYDSKLIAKKTGWKTEKIKNFINTTKELNDVSCFTNSPDELMWLNYANNRNGICLKFIVIDTDLFFPVIYLDKKKVDFTENYIKAFSMNNFMSSNTMRLSILPWVLKNKNFESENEIRLLCGNVYDNELGLLGGKVFNGKKDLMGYKGISMSYDSCGLKLVDILVGESCEKSISLKISDFIKRKNNNNSI